MGVLVPMLTEDFGIEKANAFRDRFLKRLDESAAMTPRQMTMQAAQERRDSAGNVRNSQENQAPPL